MSKFIDRTGEIHVNKQGYNVEIIEWVSAKNCTVKFKNGIILKNKQYSKIKEGKIENPLHPTVYGIGYIGLGKHLSIEKGKKSKKYQAWHGILTRSYSQDYLLRHPSYKGCSVSLEWHNYQVFGAWFDENYIENTALDKDILIPKNKIYSPETCCFVPQDINILFREVRTNKNNSSPMGVFISKKGQIYSQTTEKTGKVYIGSFRTIEEASIAYITYKEKRFKQVAEIYKNVLPEKTYKAIIDYKIIWEKKNIQESK